MRKFVTSQFKRLMAAVLGVLMLVGMLPVSAYAASNTLTMSFSYAQQSDGSLILHHGTFTSPNGTTAGGNGTRRVIIYGNGEVVFCIQPGVHLGTGDTLTANASDAWDALTDAQKNGMKTVLAFGYTGNGDNLSGSDDAQIVATQMILWEIVNGWRNPTTFARTNSAIYDAFCNSGYNPEVATVYNEIVSLIQKYPVMPSFADGSSYEMSYANGKYSVTLTDKNGVLAGCTVTSKNSNVSVSKSGNTLTITSAQYLSDDVEITVTKATQVSASAQLIAYGDPSVQDVIYGIAAPASISKNLKVSTSGGSLKVVKTSEDGVVAGIQMTITGDNYSKTVTTGSDGTITLEGLVPGTYTVTELVGSNYEPQDPQTVTVTAGQTATVTFANTLKRGSLSVTKTAEDGFVEGVKFHLYGTSLSGEVVDEYATTDSRGIATFEDVLTSDQSGYTLEEVDTAARYVIPDSQNITISWDEVTSTTVTNVLKKFNVTVQKKDGETGSAQGEGTLAGAVYGLYHDGELVDTYTTDANGSFTTSYYLCDAGWTIQEITPSEGYLLDDTVYSVGAEPENYTVEYNTAHDLTSYEQVIKGNLSIIKHSDDGSTQIETPEEGATFQVYLTSAGSYDAAAETERDVLVCDEDGFAQSKDLPYGLYTVHQVSGKEDAELMADFTVFISENGKTYRYLINNAPYSAYLKVVKADAETGETISLAGAGFQIYDASGNLVTLSYTYPTLTTVDTFYVSDDGYLITPQKLEIGNYTLVEVQAPYGYVLNTEPVSFAVSSSDDEGADGLAVITVTYYDQAQKGTITVSKSGEVFASVTVSGEEGILDKEGNWGILTPVYQPVYEVQNLSGATYQVIAAEDIYTGDGTLRVAEGTVVAELTTDQDGTATTDELYLGSYRVVEIQAPDGMVLGDEEQLVTLSYAGQEVSVTSTTAGFVNDRQKLSISAKKLLEQDETFGIGGNGEITAVSFGLYAKEEMVAADGAVIPADGLVEIAFADENGTVSFQSDLPFGTYYVKEYSTDVHYTLSDAVYEVEFAYCGQDTALQTVVLNDGQAIENHLKYGSIQGYKVAAEDDAGLAGGVFGLFAVGTEKLTADTAILTATSDETGYFAFENLPYGDYLVAELTAPRGYVLDATPCAVSITEDGQVVSLRMENTKIAGKLVISKVDADTENLLPNAGFRIYGEDGETVLLEGRTDENGVCEFELEYGSYFYQEFDAPEGYEIDDTMYAFSITEDGQVVSVVMTNEKIPEEDTPNTTTTTTATTTTSTGTPKTGDESNPALWATVAGVTAVAGVALGYFALFRKKESHEE